MQVLHTCSSSFHLMKLGLAIPSVQLHPNAVCSNLMPNLKDRRGRVMSYGNLLHSCVSSGFNVRCIIQEERRNWDFWLSYDSNLITKNECPPPVCMYPQQVLELPSHVCSNVQTGQQICSKCIIHMYVQVGHRRAVSTNVTQPCKKLMCSTIQCF